MSYDISIVYPDTKNVVVCPEPHNIYGTTYCEGGTELWYSTTFNYRPHFIEIFGENGIHTLRGMRCIDSLDLINKGIIHSAKMAIENNCYDTQRVNPWDLNWRNTCKALKDLYNLALLAPYGVWEVES